VLVDLAHVAEKNGTCGWWQRQARGIGHSDRRRGLHLRSDAMRMNERFQGGTVEKDHIAGQYDKVGRRGNDLVHHPQRLGRSSACRVNESDLNLAPRIQVEDGRLQTRMRWAAGRTRILPFALQNRQRHLIFFRQDEYDRFESRLLEALEQSDQVWDADDRQQVLRSRLEGREGRKPPPDRRSQDDCDELRI
jgi:hypothetical protein